MSSIIGQFKDFTSTFQSGHLLGVDIGLSAIKLCKLVPHKKLYKIERFTSIALPEGMIIEDDIEHPDEMAGMIDSALKRTGIDTKICNLGLDGPNTFSKRLSVPDGPKSELEDNVVWETEQFIPFSADESELDYHVLRKNKDEDTVEVIVASVKNNLLNRFQKVTEDSGLKVKVVDLKVFSLVNLLEGMFPKDVDVLSQEGRIILDMGAQSTKVIVYKNGGPSLTKEIFHGGSLITEEIQRQMGLSFSEAEDLKIHGDENGNWPEEILTIMHEKVDELIFEIKKVLNFYIATGSSENIAGCFITGGNSLVPGVQEKLSEVLDMEVEFLNPLENFTLNSKVLKFADEDYINACGAVAIGLAMRKI